MTSDKIAEAFVWIWLAGEPKPVIAGRLGVDAGSGDTLFNYGRSYLQRVSDGSPSISIYEPELPLEPGVLPLLRGLTIPGCIQDASPDAWGRRVIMNRLLGQKGKDADTGQLDELTYLLESASDRTGALDFQQSPTEYKPRITQNADLEVLLAAAESLEKGEVLAPELAQALSHGSSIGGARPKASLQVQGRKYIAKFSLSSDLYSVIKAEFVAMRLAALAGLCVAPVRLAREGGKDVLLVERFDRVKKGRSWTRKPMVSALTLLGLDEMMARYASYEKLAEIIRQRFSNPKDTLKELFSRLVFNILCGNTDDHARNHAAFWDGKALSLTPAYDICPQGRAGNEAGQAMKISGNNNLARLATCLEAAPSFLLSKHDAGLIFDHLIDTIRQHWDSVCEEAELSPADSQLLWGRQFLNPFSVER